MCCILIIGLLIKKFTQITMSQEKENENIK